MDLVTSIVRISSSLQVSGVAERFSYAAALAWYIPTRYQLRRRWCFRQSMPSYTLRELRLPIQRTGTNGMNTSTSG
jgi:hypothetical protein